MTIDFSNKPRFAFTQVITLPPERNLLIDGEPVDRDMIEQGHVKFLGYVPSNFEFEYDEEEYYDDPESENAEWLIKDPGQPENGRRFSINYESKEVWIEGVDEPMSLGEFNDKASRVDESGKLICQMSLKLEEQYRLCLEHSEERHLDDIDAAFDQMKRGSPDSQTRAYAHDIMKIKTDDAPLSFEDVETMRREILETSIIVKNDLESQTESQWMIAFENPAFRMPQIRAVFTELMKDRLGEYPIEKVAMTLLDDYDTAIKRLEQIFPNKEEQEPFTVEHLMPGYKTSPVIEFSDGPLTLIVFKDHATPRDHFAGRQAAYGYAYYKVPKLESEPEAPSI